MLYQRRVSVGMSKIAVVICLLLFDFRRVVENVSCSVYQIQPLNLRERRKGCSTKNAN
jgi:hypothetical protein